MDADTNVQLVVKFFTFMFLDERMALESAGRIVAWQKASAQSSEMTSKKTTNTTTRESFIRSDLVRSCAAEFFRNHRANAKYVKSLNEKNMFQSLSADPWSKWQKFHSRTQNEVVLVVLLKMILGFSGLEICEGLGITEGTLRLRLNQGLQSLGTEPQHA